MNGYTEFKGKYQLTTYDFIQWIKGGTGNYDLSHYGWTWQKTSDSNATINEGDLLLKTSSSAHIELYAIQQVEPELVQAQIHNGDAVRHIFDVNDLFLQAF